MEDERLSKPIQTDRVTLREQSIESLRESTRLLKQATDLFKQGKYEEAEQLREAARLKSQESAALADEAMRLK